MLADQTVGPEGQVDYSWVVDWAATQESLEGEEDVKAFKELVENILDEKTEKGQEAASSIKEMFGSTLDDLEGSDQLGFDECDDKNTKEYRKRCIKSFFHILRFLLCNITPFTTTANRKHG